MFAYVWRHGPDGVLYFPVATGCSVVAKPPALHAGVGKLMTVFSAPDYPQFQCSQDERYNNLGAVAVLGAAGEYCQPRMLQYRAAVRPQVNAALHSFLISAKCTVRTVLLMRHHAIQPAA